MRAGAWWGPSQPGAGAQLEGTRTPEPNLKRLGRRSPGDSDARPETVTMAGRRSAGGPQGCTTGLQAPCVRRAVAPRNARQARKKRLLLAFQRT